MMATPTTLDAPARRPTQEAGRANFAPEPEGRRTMTVQFGRFELDPANFELRRDGVPVTMEPQVFDVLRYLVERRDRVVPKEELLDEIWGDRFVSESALTTRIKQARRAVDDDGATQRVIRTARGRGFRFIAPVGAAPESLGRSPTDEAPAPSAPTPGRLPSERTRLLGRDEEIDQVAALVPFNRLTTLLGFGGTGKTRLAVAAARRLADQFDDGVHFVDLVPTDDVRSVEIALADATGLGLTTGDARAQLIASLAERDALVVIDNCEHVRAEVAGLLDELVERTTSPRFLATSRTPLGVPGERRVPVGPLRVEATHSTASVPAAVALFLDVAERLGSRIPAGDVPVVASICDRLDGLPLAIELAAAQTLVLTPGEIAARLGQRFELLRDVHDGESGRHASLEAVLTDTWALLDDDEQAFVGRLASFPGRFGLDDVTQLCELDLGEATASLTNMVNRSLAVRGAAARPYRLLETVRLFAAEASERSEMLDDHADWCLAQVGDDFAAHVDDLDVAEWCAGHHHDIDAAERHLLGLGRVDDAARLRASTCMALHHDIGTRAADGLERIARLLPMVDDPATAARLHITGAHAAMAARAPEAIAEHGKAAVAAAVAAGDRALEATALVVRSWTTVFTNVDAAIDEVDRAERISAELDDPAGRDLADGYRAFHLIIARRYDEAIARARAVVNRTPAADVRRQSAFVARVALACCLALERPDEVRPTGEELLRVMALERPMWANQVLMATIHAAGGDLSSSCALIDLARRQQDAAGRECLPDLLIPAAVAAHQVGEHDLARRWLRAVRDAGRPTQSFQATCLYRRAREAIGITDEPPTSDVTLDAIGAEAFDWIDSLAAHGFAGRL
jgi:predicted ATPase/DNA-binding winged helix-turn-helix (wHTH) protein